MAFFSTDSKIRRIVYYPEVYSFEISEKHVEKRTNFVNNTITPILGDKICSFIDYCKLELDIRFEKMKFGKINNSVCIRTSHFISSNGIVVNKRHS